MLAESAPPGAPSSRAIGGVRRPLVVALSTIHSVSFASMTAPRIARTSVAAGPSHRDVARLPDRPRPARAAARRGPPSRARPLAGRVRRAAPARRGSRAPAPDESARRPGPPESQRRHPADRPARPRRLGRARYVPDRRPRRGGRADGRGAGSAADGGADPSPRDRRSLRRRDRPGGSRNPSVGRCATSLPASTPMSPRRIARRAHDRDRPRRDQRLRLSGLGAALLSRRPPGRRAPAALRLAPLGVRAEQHLLPAADAGQGRRLAGRHAARLPLRGQGPARRLVPLAARRPGRQRAVADGSAPAVRRAARDRAVPRARQRPPRRRPACRVPRRPGRGTCR